MNVFGGQNGIRDFLNPENHLTPLIELPSSLNPFENDGVHIFIKMQTFLPLMNIKCIPAYQMLKDNGQGHGKLVEASSGNTAFSLAILSHIFGYEQMTAVVSDETSDGKIKMLQMAGADVIITNEEISPSTNGECCIKLAQEMGKNSDCNNLDQYQNTSNPLGHYLTCGKQILRQMQYDIQVFCTSLGTTGTFYGISKIIKEYTSAACIGVVKKIGEYVPGPRNSEQIKISDFEWKNYADELTEEGTEQSYLQSLKMCQNGILVGPSSGLNLAGLLKFLQEQKQKGKLDDLKNDKGEINCVILGCDLPFPYLDEYFKYLPSQNFGTLQNQELLKNKKDIQIKNS